jgi:hypothetical protein
MASPPPCPAPPELERFLLGQVAEAQAASIEEHLAQCGRCLETVHLLKAEDTLIEAMQRAAALKAQEPEEAVLTNLIARFSRLAASGEAPAVTDTDASQAQDASTGEGTGQASHAPPPADSTQEVYDFLAPPQGPGEIGRLGPYRVVKVLGVGLRRQLAQLVIDQRQELLGGMRIALLDGGQDTGHIVHRRHQEAGNFRHIPLGLFRRKNFGPHCLVRVGVKYPGPHHLADRDQAEHFICPWIALF